jgi:eukaryotic-like serine/threonine-protein kinase
VTEVGRLIADRYRLTEHIGSGAMGVVWQAHDERLHRTVALKQLLLQPGLSAAEAHEARERAMREGRIAARLQHPNAVTVYDVVEDDGQPVLIMEYVPSKSLSAVLDERGPLAPTEVARIGAQVATALTIAHTAGIVHRDIKPGNVLLADDGTVKITDFGISRATGDVTVTATGMLAGTPAYLAPEVAKGENPGPPSDVFSLASTVYAAVEGQPPFGLGENTLALLHLVAACRTIPPRKAGPLTLVLSQMLRANPNDRPTMAEACRALNAIAAGQTALPNLGPNTGPTPVQTPARPDIPVMSGSADTVRTFPPRPPQQYGMPMAQQGPPTPPRAYPAQHPQARPRPRQRPNSGPSAASLLMRKRLLTALAVVLAILLGIIVANFFVDTSGDQSSAPSIPLPSTSTAAGQPSVADQPIATETPSWTTAANETSLTTAPPPPTATVKPTSATAVAEVRAYCALLPQQTAQAWQLLSPAEQSLSGGFDAYQQTWSGVSAVQIGAAVPHGASTVVARIRLTDTSGKASDDVYTFKLAVKSGALLINNIAVAGKQKRG